MDIPGAPALEMRQVVKSYQWLRPLRIASLSIEVGEHVSIGGVDAGAGELFVNLVTGAALPDEGEVRVQGQRTADISDGDQWLTSLDRFGLVSGRAVLLEGASLKQNLALPYTLEIDPVPDAVADRVEELARRCGIEPGRWLSRLAGALPPEIAIRGHLARALALEPDFLLLEHPTAGIVSESVEALATDLCRACEGSRATVVTLTCDDRFARLIAPRNLTLHGASGEVKPLRRGWLRW